MGFIIRIIKKVVRLILYLGIFIGIIVLIPNLPPYTKFTSIELAPAKARMGPLAPNEALNKAQHLFVDKVMGPEAFQVANGELYTSLSSGEIVKLSPGGHVTYVTKLGQPCDGLTQEHICGRPLGFEIDTQKNEMYVADAYHGIWKVNLKTDKKQLLVSPRVEINGRLPKLFNDIALAKNGDLYWTDSTSDFNLKDGAMSMLTDPSGRLFYYNAAKNESKVLLDNLWFSNGLVLSPDNQFVVVAETCKLRLLKYYVDGPKKGKSEVFADGLPGAPDNVRVLPDGSGVLVALYTVYDEEHPLLTRSLAQTPVLRKFFARLLHLIELPFLYMNTVYPHFFFDDVAYHIGHFKSVSGFLPPLTGLLQIDWNGNIVASYFNTDRSLKHISDAVVFNNKLHTGSPGLQNYIGVLPAPPQLLKAFASAKGQPMTLDVAKEAPKAQTQPPKSAPRAQEKPKVEKEVPKVAKPVKQEAKPTQPPKPVETPTTTPKPAPAKPTPAPAKPTAAPAQASKPTQPPKQAEKLQKQTETTTNQPETKPTTAKPVEVKSTTPKPPVKPTAPPKPAEKPSEKPAAKPADTAKSGSAKVPHEKVVPKQIPIEEEIPSDTAKPNKETLKVIKKGIPTEIPNPHL